MNPVTGPFSDVFSVGVGKGSRYWSRQIYRQQKPYDLPLPYSRDDRGVGNDIGWGTNANMTNTQKANVYGTRSPPRIEDLPSWFKTSVENQARERLMNKIGSEALLWATLYEAKRSINMMANDLERARTLFLRLPPGLLHAVKRATLIQEVGRIGVYGVGKTLADDVLKVYFGYKPIMSDVQTCAENLSKDFDPVCVDSSAKRRDVSLTSSTLESNWWRKKSEWWYKSKMGCYAKVANPNQFLAQKLGLVNPFATAWELMQWSFVIDYFVNVGQFVGSLTETYGLQLTKPWTRNTMGSFTDYLSRDYNLVTHVIRGEYDTGIWYRACRASTGLPSVRLGFRQFSLGKDLSRLVTSSALLLQALTKGNAR